MGTKTSWLNAYRTLQSLGLNFDQADTCLADARKDGLAADGYGDTVVHDPSDDTFTIEVSRTAS